MFSNRILLRSNKVPGTHRKFLIFVTGGGSYYGVWFIRRQNLDLRNLKFLGYDKTKPKDFENKDKFVHFFIDDYKFESI